MTGARWQTACVNVCAAAAAAALGLCGSEHERPTPPPQLSCSSAQPLINAQEIRLLRRQKIALHNKRSTI